MKAEIVMVQEFPIEGLLRLRINTYREPGEVGYEEHHVQVPVIPEGGYPGEKDAEGNPVDPEAYNAWIEGLPKEEKNNPCLNQFVQVPIGTPKEKIAEIVAAHTKRVKAAGLNVESLAIQEGLKAHLKVLEIDSKIGVRARSISGLDAVKADHSLLTVKM